MPYLKVAVITHNLTINFKCVLNNSGLASKCDFIFCI